MIVRQRAVRKTSAMKFVTSPTMSQYTLVDFRIRHTSLRSAFLRKRKRKKIVSATIALI
jgi:hypothetical protein